jgi:hypothetical protein
MKFVVYDGMAEAFDRKFDDGDFVYLKRGIVTGISDELFSVLKDCKNKNRIVEVTALDGNAKRVLK